MKRLALILCLALTAPLATTAMAVQPDEMLSDPALEARAREVSKGLRCLVCRNESIDESNAGLAKDLRLLVRERIMAGDSNDETVAYIVDRYGEYVLLTPTHKGANRLLWAAGPAMLIAALVMAGLYLRRRSTGDAPQEAALSPEEEKRLREIMDR